MIEDSYKTTEEIDDELRHFQVLYPFISLMTRLNLHPQGFPIVMNGRWTMWTNVM